MAPICTALNLSDESKCQDEATSTDGLFCRFHSKECYGLYRGYKIRNARLDALDASPPVYLASSKAALRNETFADVDDETVLNELHTHLFKKHALLDRVIRARKLHHSHFYSLNLDYGHKAYLDKLTNDKFVVLRALERLERRIAEVLYAQQKWFKWVRDCQDEEETAREKESEMIKKEAKLFKRRWKEVEARMKDKRRQEDEKRQQVFLDEAYQERTKQMSDEEQEESWDPIEDAVEDERQSFVELMRHLLWLRERPEVVNEEVATSQKATKAPQTDTGLKPAANGKENVEPNKSLSKNARKRAKAKAKATELPKENAVEEDGAVKVEVNETREEMTNRLSEGVKYRVGEGIRGSIMAGTIENPMETTGKVPGMPKDEVTKVLDEVAEIKLFLFCRLLLSQAAMLPAALRADTVDEFLRDPEISTTDLRDLCLKVEQPSLQEIRNACADFFRGENEVDEHKLDNNEDESESEEETRTPWTRTKKSLPLSWRSKHDEQIDARDQAMHVLQGDSDTMIDFGAVEDGEFKNKKIRVKVCGRTIWNYPSEQAMARGGWLHYSIIAKGSKLADAIELCRNWDEFWELNVLAIFRYFPSPRWEQWSGSRFRQQLLQLGFIPYLWFDQAEEWTMSKRAGGHGQGPRIHAVAEYKNIIAGHIKRNDPVSRRFVQYLAMYAGHIQLLVRDAKTGRILVEPPEEHRWLVREKGGLGRTSRTEWIVRKSVGEDMFEQISGKKVREWQFGFTSYYDIIVWDSFPGKNFANLYKRLQRLLIKAHRFCVGTDMYNPIAPIIKTLCQERDTKRTRDVRPGEDSIYDDLHHEGSKFVFIPVSSGTTDETTEESPSNWFYTDIDAAEDVLLFPEVVQGKRGMTFLDQNDPIFRKLARAGPDSKRFILGLESDDDSDEYDEIEELKSSKDKSTKTLKNKPQNGRHTSPGLTVRNAREGGQTTLVDSDCTCNKCQLGEYELCEAWEDELPGPEVILEVDDDDPETMALVLALDKIEPDRLYSDDPETDFMQHLDREKSKVFKKCWYEAILDSDERAKYKATTALVTQMTGKEKMSKRDKRFCLRLLIWLKVHTREHRLVWRDMVRAFAVISLFFSGGLEEDPTKVEKTKDTRAAIADTTSRAQTHPHSRTSKSNASQANDFWKEVDELYKVRRHPSTKQRIEYDWESDKKLRPVLAHLFKAGVIGPSYYEYALGNAVPLTRSGNEGTLYIDYRRTRPTWPTREKGLKQITDPYAIDLKKAARDFAIGKPNARFALLRVWSHSHFYPLMLGFENREIMGFEDEIERHWTWKFVPKDMAGSEWSMQKSLEIRVDPFKKQFGKQVIIKREMLLVMAKDEEELKRFAVAVTFAVQTNPWRLDVDLWKSFVNVDLAFLEALDEEWWE